jgi:aspartate racemase
MKKTIGIVGGMGPLATSDLFRKIIEVTEAASDQDHAHVLIDNNTNIPDRTAAILHGGADPVPELTKSAQRLKEAGADLLIMPCNTAHYFYEQVAPQAGIPFLHMIRETAETLRRQGRRCVGLLATDGTVQSGVYGKAFEEAGIEMLCPDAAGQQAVMDVIYKGIKAGNMQIDLTGFEKAMDDLLARGAEVLVLGCTELPVAFQEFAIDRPNIDPTHVLASAAVRFAGAPLKEEVRQMYCFE